MEIDTLRSGCGVSTTTEFEALWGNLKVLLNLTDADLYIQDLDMGYKVEINNGIAKIGFLGRGKVQQQPTYYPHPSSAKKAADNFAKKTGLKYKIVEWSTPGSSIVL